VTKKQQETPGFAPGEAEAIVRTLEPLIREAAKKAWARHPNNPANKAKKEKQS
jgi:hypothetical protein